MAYATAHDGIRLYYEEAGAGTPIVFVHEFGGDHRSWEPQMRFFSRRHRCVTYGARGYPPSDVPESLEAYSQAIAVKDIVAVMDACGIVQAHAVGLSMGGFATLHLGLTAPERVLSLVVAGAGYGAEKQYENYFRDVSLEVANQFETQGAEVFARTYSQAGTRVQFQAKDLRGWEEFAMQLGQHSARGSALTMRGVQARRPSIYDLEQGLKAMRLPMLVIVGDEDFHCLQPGIFLKMTVPAAGLAVLPKSGHTLNLEEPEAFNRCVAEFIAAAEAGAWKPRDPRANPGEIMKTK